MPLNYNPEERMLHPVGMSLRWAKARCENKWLLLAGGFMLGFVEYKDDEHIYRSFLANPNGKPYYLSSSRVLLNSCIFIERAVGFTYTAKRSTRAIQVAPRKSVAPHSERKVQ